MDQSADCCRYSLDMRVHEATSSAWFLAGDCPRAQWHPLGSDQPSGPIPLRTVMASAPGKALDAFCAAIRRSEIEAPLEGDRIGLWLTVDHVGCDELQSERRFLGTAMVREGRCVIEPHPA